MRLSQREAVIENGPAQRTGLRGRVPGALRHRNYRLFFFGQVVSQVGTWMQSIAQAWLVLQITHNGFLLGLVLAAQFAPMLVAGPFGGLVADRFPKRRILLVTQTLLMVPAVVLFVISATHVATFWMVLLAALTVGTINVVDMPTRQAFVVDMVGREDLMNAIALNSTIFNVATIFGPSAAGIVIAIVGVSPCFLVNAVSFLAAIAALALMRNLPSTRRTRSELSMLHQIREGARYAIHDPVVGMMLAAVAVVSLFAMNRMTLLPLFAQDVLHAGAAGFGFLMAFQGCGAVAGALSIALVRGPFITGRRQFWIAIAWSVALVAFSASRIFLLSGVLLFLAGYCQICFIASANNRIQTNTPDELRGRVMALYAQALIGVGPFGSAQAGGLATLFGAPIAMAIGATVAGAFVTLIRFLRPEVFTTDSD